MANLTVTTTSAFATMNDQLGNPYQAVVNITGSRVYTFLTTKAQLNSTVTGLSTSASLNADQRFYPYQLLSSAPGVYTMTTAPYLDNQGIGLSLSPSVPVNGAAPGSGTMYNATSIYFTTTAANAVLTEKYYTNLPNVTLQQQYYVL